MEVWESPSGPIPHDTDPEHQVVKLCDEAQTVKNLREGIRATQLQLEAMRLQMNEMMKDT